MSEEELKLTRRLFLRHSAVVSAATAGAYGITVKTDALARADEGVASVGESRSDGVLPYIYTEEPR